MQGGMNKILVLYASIFQEILTNVKDFFPKFAADGIFLRSYLIGEPTKQLLTPSLIAISPDGVA